jgi:hypothetical protein
MGRFGYCLPCDADIPVARLAPSGPLLPDCAAGTLWPTLVIQAWLLTVLTA